MKQYHVKIARILTVTLVGASAADVALQAQEIMRRQGGEYRLLSVVADDCLDTVAETTTAAEAKVLTRNEGLAKNVRDLLPHTDPAGV
jgi:hypothetical protein